MWRLLARASANPITCAQRIRLRRKMLLLLRSRQILAALAGGGDSKIDSSET